MLRTSLKVHVAVSATATQSCKMPSFVMASGVHSTHVSWDSEPSATQLAISRVQNKMILQ